MSDMRDQNQILDLLDRTLETYGSDAARWPAGVRLKLSPFVDGNADAQRRIADARALDKVLGFAPQISVSRQAELANQIVERAIRQPRTASLSELPARSSPVAVPASRLNSRLNSLRNHSLAAAALAASLMIGILAGQNATVVTLAESLITGGEVSGASGQQVAQSDDIEIFWDEDLL